ETLALSAFFIWLIIFLFLLMLSWIMYCTVRALLSIRFLNQLVRSTTPEALPSQSRDLHNKVLKRPHEGRLWIMYEDAWVRSSDGQYIQRTADAAEFFTPRSMARGIIGNRLVTSMPGILTALGILGTFVGLQLGLSSLDLSSPQVLSQSIVPLISGAAVAFSTSVWGILASVSFNFLEKLFEQLIGARVERLVIKLNSLCRPYSVEQGLANIERSNKEAEEALKGLAEQIADQMQEKLLDSIQTGIQEAMIPAVERLVEAAESLADKQSSGAQEALSSMIAQFIDSVSQSGEESRKGLESASAQLGESISQWSESMEAFMTQLEDRTGEFDSQIGGLLQQGNVIREEANVSQQFLARVVGDIQKGGELLNEATRNMGGFGENLQKAAQQLSEAQTEVAKLAESSAKQQQAASESLMEISQKLAQANDGLTDSSEALKASAEVAQASFQSLTEEQQNFIKQLRKTLTDLRKQVGQMMQDYATDVEGQTRQRMEQWNMQTQDFSKNMVAAVQMMSEILTDIEDRLKK
ncbi:MAG: anti-phage ZorAB system protein ZorA, partial [Pseudomonadota bacterium]